MGRHLDTKNKPAVYLAGPITGLSYHGATDWRAGVVEELWPRIVGYSPMRGKTYLAKETKIGHTYENTILSGEKAIFHRDVVLDVRRADLVLVNFLGAEKVSIGTVFEMGVAWELRKPIVTIMEIGNTHDHPFIRQASGWVVPNLTTALDTIRAILLEDL